jgi:general secretion pathway protein M
MSARLIDMLLKLSSRERLLTGLMMFVILPLALVFGLLLPIQDRHAQAITKRVDALALGQWVQERIDEKAHLAQTPAARIGPPIGSAEIENSLIAANLRSAVTALGVQGDGNIELSFDRVNFMRLANWLSATHPDWGYSIQSYQFDPDQDPGFAAARLILTPRNAP